jgi:hypothetical protein
MVPVAPVITGITFAFIFHIKLINIYETQEWSKDITEITMIAYKEAKSYKV